MLISQREVVDHLTRNQNLGQVEKEMLCLQGHACQNIVHEPPMSESPGGATFKKF